MPDPAPGTAGSRPGSRPATRTSSACLDLLLGAERPVIVAGHGVALGDASAELAAFAAAVGVPVATTPLGKGVFDARARTQPRRHRPQRHAAANWAARNADVILALGTRFDDRATSSWLPGYTYSIPPARLIHVISTRRRSAQLSARARDRGQREGRPRPARARLARRRRRATGRAARLRRPAGAGAGGSPARESEWEATGRANRRSDARPLRPERVLADLRAVLPDDGILLADVGVHHNWIVQEWPAYAPRTALQSWGFASMGFGVGGVLGARLAAPDRARGRGRRRRRLPAHAERGRDRRPVRDPRGLARLEQRRLHLHPRPAARLLRRRARPRDELRARRDRARRTPRTSRRMARAMGADGTTVEAPGDLAGALDAALASGRPTVLDVAVDPDAAPPRPRAGTSRPCPTPSRASAGTS